MRKTTLFALALLASLPGAALAQESMGGHTIYRDARPEFWQGNITRGALTHLASGAAFPEQIGEYRRKAIMVIDDGDDAMVQYEARFDGRQALVSVFLFKPADLPEHALKGAVAAIGAGGAGRMGGAGTFLWSDGPFGIDAGQKLRAYKATFKTGIGPGTYLDYLYFAPLGQWTVKVRATLDEPHEVEVENSVNALVRALPWQAIMAANGPCTGKACQLDGAFAMNSHVNEGMITRLAAMLESRSAGEVAKVGGTSVLFDIEKGGAKWRVANLSGPFAQLFTGAFGNVDAAEPLYTLTRSEGAEKKILRLFTGTPSEAQVRAHIDGLIAHPEASTFLSPEDVTHHLPDW